MNGQIEHWERLSVHPPDASVIDPRDIRGCKNRYITRLRNETIVAAVGRIAGGDRTPVLDFGCGTGGLSKALVDAGRTVIGVDISGGLLACAAQRELDASAMFLRYDGHRLPLADGSVADAVTYVVLNHILDDADLAMSLAEVRRVLRPGGRFIAIEQVRSKRSLDLEVWQCRRTRAEFTKLFESAGFAVEAPVVLRYGRLPTTYAIRFGWIPDTLFAPFHRMERWLGRTIGVLPWDYCDVQFMMTKT